MLTIALPRTRELTTHEDTSALQDTGALQDTYEDTHGDTYEDTHGGTGVLPTRNKNKDKNKNPSHAADAESATTARVLALPPVSFAQTVVDSAQTLIDEWVDFEVRERGNRPGSRRISAVEKYVLEMLDEGQPTGRVRAGLHDWARTSSVERPVDLASFVHRCTARVAVTP